jgi:hypothetical protein
VWDIITYALREAGDHDGDRPLSLFVIYLVSFLYPSNLEWIIKLMPVILGPLTVLSVYYFVKMGSGDNRLASLASLFTVFSYHIIVGIYAGFYANWLAIILMYAFLGFVSRLWRKISFHNYFGAIISSLGILFSHSATWVMVLTGFILFIGWSFLSCENQGKVSRKIVILFSILGLNLFADLLRVMIGARSGIDWGVAVISPIGMHQFSLRWTHMFYTFNIYVGGSYTNTIMLLLSLVGMLTLHLRNSFDRVLFSMMSMGTVAFILGDYVFQARLFYNLPIQVLGALGLQVLIKHVTYHNKTNSFVLSIILFIILSQIDYLFKTVANFIL